MERFRTKKKKKKKVVRFKFQFIDYKRDFLTSFCMKIESDKSGSF